MYFDPDNDLNEETLTSIKALSDTLLYAEDGALDAAAGTWITRMMLFSSSEASHETNETSLDSFSLSDDGYDVETIESVEDFLNEAALNKNWKKIEQLSIDAQKNWVADVLKEIINGMHDVDIEVRKYIGSIADQDKLAAYIEAGLDNFDTKRKAWLDEFIQLSIMVLIMQYRDAASNSQASHQKRKDEKQVQEQKTGDASSKVMQACDAKGGLQTHYGIDDCDAILDLLEGIVDDEGVTESDIARFVRVNSARFDEDVMYLLGTRFPVMDDE